MLFLYPLRQTNIGFGLSWSWVAVMSWGGLRGAVGLALALLVDHMPFDQAFRSRVLFFSSTTVLLTLLVNASTT